MLPVVVEMHFSPGFTRQTGHATVHAFCGRLRTLRSVSLLALAIVLSLGRVHGAVEQDDRTVAIASIPGLNQLASCSAYGWARPQVGYEEGHDVGLNLCPRR